MTLAILPGVTMIPEPSAAPELGSGVGKGWVRNSWHLDIPMSDVD